MLLRTFAVYIKLKRMKGSHRALLMVLALPLVIGAAGVFWVVGSMASAWSQEKAFYAVAQNAPRDEVVAALGWPDRVRECGKNLWWGDDTQYRGPNDGTCVTEERYEHFLSAYAIGYSSQGRVVSKYRYVSE